ncbi:Nat2p [Sporobolomyces salmoneus]|uniref:Nat2p n=1 Tax=Sporobolomyces salmoneus TaxID=183962 RepID=UPI00317F0641
MLPTLTRTRLVTRSSILSGQIRSISSPNLSSSSILSVPLSTCARPLLVSPTLSNTLLTSLTPSPFRFRPQSRFNSSSSSSSSSAPPPPPPDPSSLSLTARLKLLFKTHGWTALTLYLILSFIDFSLTFVLVWSIGADRVREFEDWVLQHLGWRRRGENGTGEKGVLRQKVEEWKEKRSNPEKNLKPVKEVKEVGDGQPVELGTKEVTTMGGGKKSAYSAYATTAVLAYAIHKTALLPVRVGITVWATPKVVRLLQSWGYKVGRMPATAEVAAQAAARKVKPVKVK